MNGFDIALLVILSMLVLLGALKGLTRLLIGIGALIAAFMLAAQLHEPLAVQLRRMMDFPEAAVKLRALRLSHATSSISLLLPTPRQSEGACSIAIR